VSSSAEPDKEPTKLFGLFSIAECEGRNWPLVVARVDDADESVRKADRLYLSGAGLAGADGAREDCDEEPLLDIEDRDPDGAPLVPGTGSDESSRVPAPVCNPVFALLGRLVIDALAE